MTILFTLCWKERRYYSSARSLSSRSSGSIFSFSRRTMYSDSVLVCMILRFRRVWRAKCTFTFGACDETILWHLQAQSHRHDLKMGLWPSLNGVLKTATNMFLNMTLPFVILSFLPVLANKCWIVQFLEWHGSCRCNGNTMVLLILVLGYIAIFKVCMDADENCRYISWRLSRTLRKVL